MKIKKAFRNAEKKNIAIGHFNVSNLETFEAVVRASSKTRRPVIVGVSEGAISHAGIDFFIWAKEHFGKKYPKANFFLHLDHGRDIDILRGAIDGGFDSVMIDASHFDFKKNIYLTRYIVKKAHKKGVFVEAEIGRIGNLEEGVGSSGIVLTTPFEALEFAGKTGCDLLAVSIGTTHGPNKFAKKSKLEFENLKRIKAVVNIPLVLHGASEVRSEKIRSLKKLGCDLGSVVGVNERDLRKAIRLGIRKVNNDTDLQIVMAEAILEELKGKKKEIKIYKILEKASDLLEEDVVRKIRLFTKP